MIKVAGAEGQQYTDGCVWGWSSRTCQTIWTELLLRTCMMVTHEHGATCKYSSMIHLYFKKSGQCAYLSGVCVAQTSNSPGTKYFTNHDYLQNNARRHPPAWVVLINIYIDYLISIIDRSIICRTMLQGTLLHGYSPYHSISDMTWVLLLKVELRNCQVTNIDGC